jgi:hypothetical protein
MQNDGNLVMFDGSQVPLWATNTIRTSAPFPRPASGPGATGILGASTEMYSGEVIDSANSLYHLVYQGDGNLVLYDPEWTPLWASNTTFAAPGTVAMQSDGNLVISARGMAARACTSWCRTTGIWCSSTRTRIRSGPRIRPRRARDARTGGPHAVDGRLGVGGDWRSR